jgi:hypothetical protein
MKEGQNKQVQGSLVAVPKAWILLSRRVITTIKLGHSQMTCELMYGRVYVYYRPVFRWVKLGTKEVENSTARNSDSC